MRFLALLKMQSPIGDSNSAVSYGALPFFASIRMTNLGLWGCLRNGLDRSVNLPTCWGGGTRKARDGGANCIKIYGRAWKPAPTTGRRVDAPYKRARGDPLACHSEPIGEESRFAQVYFVRLEILRFAQDDKYNPQFCSIFIFAWLGKGKTVPPDRLFRAVQIRNLLHGFICHGDGDRTAATTVFNHDHNRKG